MAAYSHQRASSRALGNHGDGSSQLPNGSCNFRDLASGARAPTCGCKRFWLNNGNAYSNGERAFCFCGHHACFHHPGGPQQRTPSQPSVAISLNRTGGGQGQHGDTPEGYYRVQRTEASPSGRPAGLGIRPDSSSQSQSINTRVWQALNQFARDQDDGGQSDTTSKLPSTAVPSIAGDTVQDQRPMGPPVNIPSAPATRLGMEDYLGSATEVATPSQAGTPDLRAFTPPGTQARLSPAAAKLIANGGNASGGESARPGASQRPQIQQLPLQPPALSTGSTLSSEDVRSLLQSYGRRLDVVESLSFNTVPIEEISDKFDLFDGRLLDLEEWRVNCEQQRTRPEPAEASNSKRRRLLPTETSSFASDGSFDSHAAAHTEAAVLATLAANAETGPRIDALESRIEDLEHAALPSFARPWQVQVVILPWGRELRGIWYSAAEATQQSMRAATQDADEWTGAKPSTNTSFRSTASGAWTTESIEAWASETQDWLSAKACGPNGTVFQRLASRGCVQDVTLTASDSGHVIDVVGRAFPRMLDPDTVCKSDELQFHGLQAAFVPLRKVRKSSRLRFLSRAEMVTPATWTAAFLDASVMMKVNDGQRRLYLTTPAAYLQRSDGGWTWPQLRQLPPLDVDGDEQAAQTDDTVAIEACWTYNDRLDQQQSTHASFASHVSRASQWSLRSQPSETGAGAPQDQQPPSPLSEARPVRQRTVSLPGSSSNGEQARAALPKRRVASFETASTVPISAQPSVAIVAAKRRRISTSPEAERRGVNFTPRWSREPPSPFHTEVSGEARSQGASSRRRGTTPFAYATPHSNSNYAGRMDFAGTDGDTEAGTDIGGAQSERAEEEWDGVQDEDAGMAQSDGDSAEHDHEIDEEDLEEGLTIYEG